MDWFISLVIENKSYLYFVTGMIFLMNYLMDIKVSYRFIIFLLDLNFVRHFQVSLVSLSVR